MSHALLIVNTEQTILAHISTRKVYQGNKTYFFLYCYNCGVECLFCKKIDVFFALSIFYYFQYLNISKVSTNQKSIQLIGKIEEGISEVIKRGEVHWALVCALIVSRGMDI